MWLLKNRTRGFYLCFVLLLAMVIGGSAIAYADSGTATATVKAGSLTESNATNRVSLSLTSRKSVRVVTYTLPITVDDARGSGVGWNLSITSTTFRLFDHDKDRNKLNKDRLPTNASSIVMVSVSCGVKSTCTRPADTISYPLLVPAGTTPPPPTKFFNATVGSGLGKFSLVMMVNVTVPAHTEGGVYSSTITLTIASGP